MRTVEWTSPEELPIAAPLLHPVSIAIGVFDGVHKGHQALLRRAIETARGDTDGEAWALTFDPNPARLTRPHSYPGDLTTPDQRARIFNDIGIDGMVLVRFSTEFSIVSGYRFLESLLEIFPGTTTVVVGFNFHLGYQRNVHAEEAARWLGARGVRVDIVGALKDNEDSISSSRVRRAVAAGDLEQAERLLGRPYAVAVDGGFPFHRHQCRHVLPPPGAYRCTYHQEDQSREGMMVIQNDGVLSWERDNTTILYVTLRSKVDGFNIGTEARDRR